MYHMSSIYKTKTVCSKPEPIEDSLEVLNNSIVWDQFNERFLGSYLESSRNNIR